MLIHRYTGAALLLVRTDQIAGGQHTKLNEHAAHDIEQVEADEPAAEAARDLELEQERDGEERDQQVAEEEGEAVDRCWLPGKKATRTDQLSARSGLRQENARMQAYPACPVADRPALRHCPASAP